jgi:hypothetical protein
MLHVLSCFDIGHRSFSKELSITITDMSMSKSSLRSLLSSLLSLTNIGSSKLSWQLHAHVRLQLSLFSMLGFVRIASHDVCMQMRL